MNFVSGLLMVIFEIGFVLVVSEDYAASGGHGSPLRSGLNLELRSHASPQTFPVKECPMCPYSSDSLSRLEEHINRQHLDLTSPSLTSDYSYDPSSDYASNFNCPICITSFPNSKDLELHVNIEHKDILRYNFHFKIKQTNVNKSCKINKCKIIKNNIK